MKLHPAARQIALHLAGGDAKRLHVLSDHTVLVLNGGAGQFGSLIRAQTRKPRVRRSRKAT